MSITLQFPNIILPAYDYWKDKVSKDIMPVPMPGDVAVPDVREVFTIEYLDGLERLDYVDLLDDGSRTAQEIADILLQKESTILWMFWKGTGGRRIADLTFSNISYVKGKDGIYRPKFIDFDLVTEPGNTFEELLAEGIADIIDDIGFATGTTPNLAQALLGIYKAMKLDGMSDVEALAEFDKLSAAYPEAVAEAEAIITGGIEISWIDSRKEAENVVSIVNTRRAIQKSLIAGDYGLYTTAIHALFPGEEESIIINKIEGEYWYSNCFRHYYTLTFDTNKGVKPVTFGVTGAMYGSATQQNFDAWQKMLSERSESLGMDLVLERYGEIPQLEIFDEYYGTTVLKQVVVDEYKGRGLAWELFGSLTPGTEEYKNFLKAEAELHCRVYKATQEPITVLGEEYQNCFLYHEKEILMIEGIEGFYRAMPLNFYGIGRTPLTQRNYGVLVDFYFQEIPAFQDYPETFFEAMEEILGLDALKEAATQATLHAGLINDYLDAMAYDGVTTIDELLTDLDYARTQEGYSLFVQDMLNNKFLGKPITIEGLIYNFPSELVSVADYEQFYEIIDAALGDLADVGTVMGYSEEDVAAAMKETLAMGIKPNEIDWAMLAVLGLVDESDSETVKLSKLSNLLDSYPVTTSKGYSLTPKKLKNILDARNPHEEVSEFMDFFVSLIGIGREKTEQSLTKICLTEADFKAICQLCDVEELRYVFGNYQPLLHTIYYTDLLSYFHELTHAQDHARACLTARNEGVELDVVNGIRHDVNIMLEGHAQEGAREKFIALDNACILSDMPGYLID
ncbi:MAG: hypothetical protein U9R52_03230, partial [Candidatus Omnitrophota bacterium]|nr:hypothetical protein [Candidatus Omnitrophota bacterium]